MLKGKLPLLISLVLALVAAGLAYHTIRQKEDQLMEKWATEPVVVAARNIMEGETLDYDKVARMKMPIKFLSPSVVRPDEVAKVIGQKISVQIQKGDPILWSQLTGQEAVNLSETFGKNARAVSLEMEGAKALSGWLRSGDHVDILGTFPDPQTGTQTTVPVLQNVVVLATGGKALGTNPLGGGTNEQAKESVTFWVLPEEALVLSQAAEAGTLRLALRSHGDLGDMDMRRQATLETVMTGKWLKEFKERKDRQGFEVIYPGGKK